MMERFGATTFSIMTIIMMGLIVTLSMMNLSTTLRIEG
jgi:hypothetical protein